MPCHAMASPCPQLTARSLTRWLASALGHGGAAPGVGVGAAAGAAVVVGRPAVRARRLVLLQRAVADVAVAAQLPPPGPGRHYFALRPRRCARAGRHAAVVSVVRVRSPLAAVVVVVHRCRRRGGEEHGGHKKHRERSAAPWPRRHRRAHPAGRFMLHTCAVVECSPAALPALSVFVSWGTTLQAPVPPTLKIQGQWSV
jgi:hypothetical protein